MPRAGFARCRGKGCRNAAEATCTRPSLRKISPFPLINRRWGALFLLSSFFTAICPARHAHPAPPVTPAGPNVSEQQSASLQLAENQPVLIYLCPCRKTAVRARSKHLHTINYYINAHSRLRQSAGHSRAGARDALQCLYLLVPGVPRCDRRAMPYHGKAT